MSHVPNHRQLPGMVDLNLSPKLMMRITTTVRVWLFALGALGFLITEAMRSFYRPWIYSHGYADFHLADTIGSSGGAITAVLILPALLCWKMKGRAVLQAAIGVWIGQVLYEFIQPWAKTGRFDWYDVIGAVVGGGIGVLIVNLVLRRNAENWAQPPQGTPGKAPSSSTEPEARRP